MRNLLVLVAGLFLALPAVAITHTWTGAVSGNWSNPMNWSPQSVPAAGEALLFPAGVPTNAGPCGGCPATMNNDLPPDTSVGPMTFYQPYTLNGNELILLGDVTDAYGDGPFVSNASFKLGASVHLGEPNNTITHAYNGGIDVNGQTLTVDTFDADVPSLNGTGTVIINGFLTLTGDGSFSGSISGGGLRVLGSIPGATVAVAPHNGQMGQVSGTGTIGTVTVIGSYLIPGLPSSGILHSQSLTMDSVSIFRLGLVTGAVSDSVQVTGRVTIAGQLDLYFPGPPAAGQFTIIDNDGTDAVNGTFAGLPDSSTFMLNGFPMRINYHGGDGNDVVIIAGADTSTVVTQNVSATKSGEQWTLTATVASEFGTPTGSVAFSADGLTLGTAPAVNGVATITASMTAVGPHNLIATFTGTGVFGNSVSPGVTHTVNRGQTKTDVVSNHSNSSYGQTVRFAITPSALAPAAGQPAGSVTILADGMTLGTVPLVNGTASFETAAFHAGATSITATYSGDTNFDGSTSSAIQQNASKAQTEVDARSRSVFVGESPLITVFVNVAPESTIVPSGVVTISEGSAILGTQLLAGGTVNVSLSPLTVGDHMLVVNYSGDMDFEASSETIVQTVGAPGLSVHGVRVLEGNRGITNVSLVVSLSVPVSQPVRVSFSTVAGSATAGEDYESASGVIEFAPGELMRTIELHVIGDTFPESDETFSVLLSNPVNATIDASSAMIVIANDDQVPPRRRPSAH